MILLVNVATLMSTRSANVMLDGLTKPYDNAFSIITPAITDSYVAIRNPEHAARIKHLTRWGMSSQGKHIVIQCSTIMMF